jgi:hypothetical protein
VFGQLDPLLHRGCGGLAIRHAPPAPAASQHTRAAPV